MADELPTFWYSLIVEGQMGYAWRTEDGIWLEGDHPELRAINMDRAAGGRIPLHHAMLTLRASDLLRMAAIMESGI